MVGSGNGVLVGTEGMVGSGDGKLVGGTGDNGGRVGGMVGSGVTVSAGTAVASNVGEGPAVTGTRVGSTAPLRNAGALTSVQPASRQTAPP